MDELTEPERRSVRLLRRQRGTYCAPSASRSTSPSASSRTRPRTPGAARTRAAASRCSSPGWAGSFSPRATSPARPRRTPASTTSGSTSTRRASPRRAARSSSPGSRSARAGLIERASRAEPPDMAVLGYRVSPLRQQRIAHFNMDALGVDRGRCPPRRIGPCLYGGLLALRRAHLHALSARELDDEPLRRHARVRPRALRAQYRRRAPVYAPRRGSERRRAREPVAAL